MARVPRNIASKNKYAIPDSLTHAMGAITATFGSSSYPVALSGLSANTLYFLYLRINSGNLELFFSTSVPSVYKNSFQEAVLIGAFYSNGNLVVEFGTFVNIEGPASTQAEITGRTTVPGVTNQTTLYRWRRDSRSINIEFLTIFSGAPAPFGSFNPDFAQNLLIDLSGLLGGTTDLRQLGIVSFHDAGINKYDGFADVNSASSVRVLTQNSSVTYEISRNLTQAIPFTLGAGDGINVRFFSLPIVGWSSTPLKDL